jgi:hypothetical protein
MHACTGNTHYQNVQTMNGKSHSESASACNIPLISYLPGLPTITCTA